MGKVPAEGYFDSITRAIDAGSGNLKKQIEYFNTSMLRHSERMEFEAASRDKKSIDTLQALNKPSYKWTRQLCDVSILHIDVSAKIKKEKQKRRSQTYSAYLLRADRISEVGNFESDELSGFYASFRDISKTEPAAIDRTSCSENVSLMSYFLYRSNRSGIWLSNTDPSGNLTEIETIQQAMCKEFETEPEENNPGNEN